MKKVYVKPDMLVVNMQTVQFLAASNEDGNLGGSYEMGDGEEGEIGEDYEPAAKGDLWEDYTW